MGEWGLSKMCAFGWLASGGGGGGGGGGGLEKRRKKEKRFFGDCVFPVTRAPLWFPLMVFSVFASLSRSLALFLSPSWGGSLVALMGGLLPEKRGVCCGSCGLNAGGSLGGVFFVFFDFLLGLFVCLFVKIGEGKKHQALSPPSLPLLR